MDNFLLLSICIYKMSMGFSVGAVIYGFGAGFRIISSVELLRAGVTWCFLVKKKMSMLMDGP
jgi:hypothetical protein